MIAKKGDLIRTNRDYLLYGRRNGKQEKSNSYPSGTLFIVNNITRDGWIAEMQPIKDPSLKIPNVGMFTNSKFEIL